ncbi:hypothetical protein MTR67_043075 [Solanum verrucosum]|uniref:Uncharacterized protein n=1 Tax=Solanum verrucosum TaxID=315347 RepID=A0AAF0UNF8_SOLVR|nr:hypothetical protein MTR67_043075 [Solanum verrucosum]
MATCNPSLEPQKIIG